MIGDRLLFLDEHKEKAKRIIEKFNFEKNKTIITIDGECGTGKSEVSYYLRSLLLKRKNLRAVIYCLDDYKENNGSIIWSEVEYSLNKFIGDIPSTPIRIYDKFIDTNCTMYYNAKNADVAIIEGTFALSLKMAKFKVFLKGTYKETEDFRLKRNLKEQNSILEKQHTELEALGSKIKPNLIL